MLHVKPFTENTTFPAFNAFNSVLVYMKRGYQKHLPTEQQNSMRIKFTSIQWRSQKQSSENDFTGHRQREAINTKQIQICYFQILTAPPSYIFVQMYYYYFTTVSLLYICNTDVTVTICCYSPYKQYTARLYDYNWIFMR